MIESYIVTFTCFICTIYKKDGRKCLYTCMHKHTDMRMPFVCVCVCVRERERERERAYLHKIVKLCEHSKHQPSQRNMPPGQKVMQHYARLEIQLQITWKKFLYTRFSPRLVKMYMRIADNYRLDWITRDKCTKLEWNNDPSISCSSLRKQ